MRVALGAVCVLVLSLSVAGCGSGNGLAHRADMVSEVMHETLGYADLEFRVWGSWADANRFLTGAASSTPRPVGFCRRRGTRRECVVADRVIAEGAVSARSSAVVRLTRALYWGGFPGGVRWKPKAM